MNTIKKIMVQITFVKEYPLPILLEYLKNLEDLYYKYLLIDRIVELSCDGITHFKIERKEDYISYFDNATNYFTTFKAIADSIPKTLRIQAFQSQEENDFKKDVFDLDEVVKIFRKRIHPVLSYSLNGADINIIEQDDSSNIKIKELKANSPINISLEGMDKVINQIFYGKYEEQRRQEEHDVAMLKENLKIGEYIASLEEKMNSSNISNSAKNYIHEMLEYTMKKQRKLVDTKLFGKIDIIQ